MKNTSAHKSILSAILYACCFLSTTNVLAVNYFFPTAGGGTLAVAPLALGAADNLTVNSGTFFNIDETFNYVVSMGASSTVTVDLGATVIFGGSLGGGGTIYSNGVPTLMVINNSGSISQALAPGTIVLENSGVAGGTITINNTGTITGNISLLGYVTGNINLNGNSIINGTLSMDPAATATTSTLSIGPISPNTYRNSSGLRDILLIDIYPNSTMYLSTASTRIKALTVQAGATIHVDSDISGVAPGDGAITNSGTMNINSAISKTGTFTNAGSGTVVVKNNSSVNTSTYNSSGIHAALMTNLNSYGQLQLGSTLNTTFAAFHVRNGGGYFPQGTYDLVFSASGINTAPTSYTIPTSTLFLQFGTPFVQDNYIKIFLTRTQFQQYASNNTNKEIAVSIESMGYSTFPAPSNSMVNILDAVEASTTVAQTNAALAQLAPLVSAPLYNLEVQDQMINQVELRLAETKSSTYVAGDMFSDNNLWFRPFTDRANQQARDATQGYYASTAGVAFGYDRQIYNNFLLGASGSYAAARVRDKINMNSSTSIKSLQFMLYGSYDFAQYSYLNWIAAISNNYFKGQRQALINNLFSGVADASYRNTLLGLKGVWGKNYLYGQYIVLTPEASLMSAISTMYKYDEHGDTAINLNIMSPTSIVVQGGMGGKASTPLEYNKYIFVPEIHATALYYLATGNQTSIAAFAEGGTQISANMILPRWGYKYGAAVTLANKKHLQLKFNYDHTAYEGYTDNSIYLTVKYIF